jgi:hypothetical protein
MPHKRFRKDAVLIADGTLVPACDHTVAEQLKNIRYSTNHLVVIDADTHSPSAGPPRPARLRAGVTPAHKAAPPSPEGDRSPPRSVGGRSVETELVVLDVLHDDAGIIVVMQQSHAYCAERDQSCALCFECGEALFAHESGADPHVEVHPVLDSLAFGDTLEVQSRAHT